MRRSIAPSSIGAESYLWQSWQAFITIIAESSFQHTQEAKRRPSTQAEIVVITDLAAELVQNALRLATGPIETYLAPSSCVAKKAMVRE
jgi:hypothetical protein